MNTSYFALIAPIWEDYQSGRIGMKARDDLLAPYRKRLHEERKNEQESKGRADTRPAGEDNGQRGD